MTAPKVRGARACGGDEGGAHCAGTDSALVCACFALAALRFHLPLVSRVMVSPSSESDSAEEKAPRECMRRRREPC